MKHKEKVHTILVHSNRKNAQSSGGLCLFWSFQQLDEGVHGTDAAL
jgi:hypothetical protein